MQDQHESKQYCLNCHHPLAPDAKYCHQCAQKNTDGKVTFLEMLEEFSDTVFNLDSRIFRTIGLLFIPGKLTSEYFKGRHKSYVHPLRMFLGTTIFLLAAATYKIGNPDFMGMQDERAKIEVRLKQEEIYTRLDTLRQQAKAEFTNPIAHTALDSLVLRTTKSSNLSYKDSISIGEYHNASFSTSLRVASTDLMELSTNDILDKYQVEGTFNRLFISQQIRLRKSGANFGAFMLGNISWMLFLMMPVLALILKLLYWRKGCYYIEHLIFSFHTHSFAFVLYIFMILFGDYSKGLIIGGGFVILILYLYKSLRNIYQQSRTKTLLKFFLMSFSYIVLITTAMLLTIVVSFAMY